jgi:hypothetical protein
MLRDRCITTLLIAALLFAISGCGPFFGLPSICEPGSESQKLSRAQKFDPYPDPNMGPAVVGGRPEGFMNPRPDASDFNKRGMPPWMQSYPPVAAAPAVSSYPATGSYYPSSNVIAPPATAVYQPASNSYAASASPYAAPASPVAAPAAAPNLVPLGPLPSLPAASQGNTTSVPGASFGSSTAPVAYGTKITAP